MTINLLRFREIANFQSHILKIAQLMIQTRFCSFLLKYSHKTGNIVLLPLKLKQMEKFTLKEKLSIPNLLACKSTSNNSSTDGFKNNNGSIFPLEMEFSKHFFCT